MIDEATITLPRLDENGLKTLFSEARTANTFASTPVSDEELSRIWETAKWAPTAMNIQPLRVVFVRPGASRERLVKHMNGNNQAKAATVPAVAVLAMDTRFHEHIPTVFPIRPEAKDMFEAEEVRLPTGQFNAALQAGYFILAVRAHGLAAGPMAGFDHAGMDAEFFPDGRFTSVLVVNIGHPGENPWFPRLPRLAAEDVVQFV